MYRYIFLILIAQWWMDGVQAQHYTFNFNSTGRRVCLVSSQVDLTNAQVKILFIDSIYNASEPLLVNRRKLGTYAWSNVANLPAGTGHWLDTDVHLGEIWEYQVKRQHTWTYAGQSYDATGYTIGALLSDNTGYKGQMILLAADDVPSHHPTKYQQLKKDLTHDGWYVQELIVPRATGWDSGNEVVSIKNQIQQIYANAPHDDKPKSLFIIGHVPMPRCGSTTVAPPDDHSQNTGARGCDGYYADIDGIYTDTATYNPSGLSTPLAINLPNDYKWDQDFFPSDVEMAFGRIDFADLKEISTNEDTLMANYLDRLSNYKQVKSGFHMGEKSAFFLGYNNSNDGSYRSLFNISKPENVYQKTDNANHNQWVKDNGPFKIYMQNITTPSISDWQSYGMNATVYASDQSYWGFGDVPQPSGTYSRIRALLGIDSKCLIALWTTTGLNIFHQACQGQSIGESMKTIINHNPTNQYLEKPQQQFDTADWWNRTHFEIWGDPTLSLYQVMPIAQLSLSNVGNKPILHWKASPDSDILGYQVYESDTEFGVFQKVGNALVVDTFIQIPNYTATNWYMVKAVKMMESGCGKFLHPSIGLSIQKDVAINTSTEELVEKANIFPNPTNTSVYITSDKMMKEVSVLNKLGQAVLKQTANARSATIDLTHLQNDLYFIQIYYKDGGQEVVKVIKG